MEQISGIGIDIEEISRFEKISYYENKSFYEKIFSKNEIEYCLSKLNPYPHFAARFCAKEAAIKALKDPNINLLNIEITMMGNIPILNLPKFKEGLISMSHTKDYAIALVIVN